MVVTFKGHPEYGIPRQSRVKIEALEPGKRNPQRRTVFESAASKSVSVDLDEGKYIFWMSKELQEGGGDYLIHTTAFYLGLTKEHPFCELKEGVRRGVDGLTQVVPAQDNTCPVCEPVWKKLMGARPRFSRGRQTTDGIRYKCGFVGCNIDNLTSATAMVLHEAEHQGINLLDNPERVTEALISGEVLAKTQEAAKQAAARGNVPKASGDALGFATP